jgi:hypothetical protein
VGPPPLALEPIAHASYGGASHREGGPSTVSVGPDTSTGGSTRRGPADGDDGSDAGASSDAGSQEAGCGAEVAGPSKGGAAAGAGRRVNGRAPRRPRGIPAQDPEEVARRQETAQARAAARATAAPKGWRGGGVGAAPGPALAQPPPLRERRAAAAQQQAATTAIGAPSRRASGVQDEPTDNLTVQVGGAHTGVDRAGPLPWPVAHSPSYLTIRPMDHPPRKTSAPPPRCCRALRRSPRPGLRSPPWPTTRACPRC